MDGRAVPDDVERSGGTEIVFNFGLDDNISMHVGASIDVAYLSYTSGGSAGIVSGSASQGFYDGTLFVSVGGQSYVQSLEGNFADTHVQLSKDANSGTLVTLEAGAPCYRGDA